MICIDCNTAEADINCGVRCRPCYQRKWRAENRDKCAEQNRRANRRRTERERAAREKARDIIPALRIPDPDARKLRDLNMQKAAKVGAYGSR